jgi:hypothetical protein
MPRHHHLIGLLFLLLLAGCDHGLEPPDAPGTGTIRGTIFYADDGATWPPQDSLHDLRFVALPFVPRDTLDLFRDLSQLVFSPKKLQDHVPQDTFSVQNVEAQTYVYSGVAQQFGSGLFDWRPVGLYQENGGIFEVRPGEVTELTIMVDFRNLPPFPPGKVF